jgi:hypothetical protein
MAHHTEFLSSGGFCPTIAKFLVKLKDKINLKESCSSLRIIIQDLGFSVNSRLSMCRLSLHDFCLHKCRHMWTRLRHLSALYCWFRGEGAGFVLGGSTEDMAEQCFFFFWCLTVSIGGGVGRFVPMVMVVERGDVTCALGIFQILVPCSQFRYVLLCVS